MTTTRPGAVLSTAEEDTVEVDLDGAPLARRWPRPAELRPRLRSIPHPVWVAVVVLVGLAARLWQLDAVGFNSDEAVYAGQAASIAGDPQSLEFFPIFRAHPLLVHTTISLVFSVFGVSDLAARLTAVAFGLGNVLVAYLLGRELYGRRCGLLAGALVAVMPYHVIVSRQVLLDGPQSFLVGLSIWALARYVRQRADIWLYLSALFLGLSVLAKETSVIMVGSAFAFLALYPAAALRARQRAGVVAVFVAVVAIYPISLRLAHAGKTGGAFLTYQLFRRPNHTLDFYPSVVPSALGWGVLAAALLGVVIVWGRVSWRETLLWSFIVVPVIFFELFPVKGYQYLLPVATPVAVLAARSLLAWPAWVRRSGRRVPRWAPSVVMVLVLASALVPTLQQLATTQRDTALAGTGGIPGGRELGTWIDERVPQGVTMMTIGPSMANLVKWYGHRNALGLSVSPNPLYRNPVYDPIVNPDLAIRRNRVQYLVWDSFSADRSPFFSASLLRYVDRYSGREVYRQDLQTTNAAGRPVRKPVVIVYEVHP